MRPFYSYRPYRPFAACASAGGLAPFLGDDLADLAIDSHGTFARAAAVYYQQPDLSLVSIAAGEPVFSGARWTGTGWSLLDGVGDPLPGPFGLLMEPAFTQLARNSEDANAWTKTGVSVAQNDVTAPDGSATGDTLTVTATSSPRIGTALTVADNAWVFLSVFVKPGTAPFLNIRARQKDAVTYLRASFNLTTFAVAAVDASIVNATITPAAEGWYRASISLPAGTGANTVLLQIMPVGADGSITGVIDQTMSVWGMMAGVIADQTSIPAYFTCGATDTVRAKDQLSYSGITTPNSYDLTTDAGVTTLTDWDGVLPDVTKPTVVYSIEPSAVLPQKYTVHHYVSVEPDVTTAEIEANMMYPGIVGFQKRYTWKSLENVEGVYTFDAIADDLAWAAANNMQMIAMIEDKGFSPTDYVVPTYLEAYASVNSKGALTLNRWQAVPQARHIALTAALAAAFDQHPNFEGVSFQETALGIADATLISLGYTPEDFRDSIIATMIAAKEAFVSSNVYLFQNFMAEPEAPPFVGQDYLEAVGLAVGAAGVQVGGPDLLPNPLPDQTGSLQSQNYPHYPVWAAAGVKLFCSAQNDSYRCPVPDLTDVYWTPDQIRDFGRDTLKVNLILWNWVAARSFATSYKYSDAASVFASDWADYLEVATSAEAYNRYDAVVGGQDVMLLVPNTNSAAPYDSRVPTPVVIYSHGASETESALLDDALKADVVAALIEAGYILCGTLAHGNNWGNQASVDDYDALDIYVRATRNISHMLLWGQSMGGLAALTVIGQSAISPVGALFTYPVCNLANLYGLGTYTANINIAYGITGVSPNTYAEKTAGYDPVLELASVYGSVPMRFYASSSDTTVPKVDNADQFAALVASTRVESDVVACIGAHGNPSHFLPTDYLDFFARCLAPMVASAGSVISTQSVSVTFNRCVAASATTGIQIRVNAGTWTAVASVASGSLATWVFTTTQVIAEGDTVEWRYQGGTNAITDCVWTGDVGALAAITLQNDLDQTAPTLVSAEVGTEAANTFVVVFDEDLVSADFTAGWTILADATALTVTAATEAPAGTLQITTTESVTAGQTVTLGYSSVVGDIEDATGNPVATFANVAVTNNVLAVTETTYATSGALVTVGAQSVLVPGVGIVG